MAANIANRRKTYIKQPGLMRKSPKRFCILTNVLIGVDITIPNGVREIPENCFRQCFALKKVYFSEGVCNVGMSAFEECSNLREVYFPSTIERISIPFVDCDNLKIVSFASGSRFVSENNVIRTKNWDEIVCVWGASSRAWNSFKIPETVRKIGDAAFIGCEKLRAIHIPSSVEEIGINPFICDNVAKSGMSAVQLVLLAIANFGHPISINDKTHGIRL